MSVGSKDESREKPLWIAYDQMPRSGGHPFYRRLNELLKESDFDGWVEDLCRPFFKERGRPSIPPGVYFRMVLIGYFEGIRSERGIAWRCADSLSLRAFLGYELNESTPNHSSLSIWRNRLTLDVFQAVFARVLAMVASHRLLDRRTLGIDAPSRETDADLKGIAHGDAAGNYQGYLERLMAGAGQAGAALEERIRLDRKRKGRKPANKKTGIREPAVKETRRP